MLRALIKDTAIYGMADFIFKFLNFATFPIFAHIFGVADYGVLSLATTAAALVAVVINCGLNNAVSRYYWEPEMNTSEQQTAIVSTGLFCLFAWSIGVTGCCMIGFYGIQDSLIARYDITWTCLSLAIAANIPAQIIAYCTDVVRLHFTPWRFTLISAAHNLVTIALTLCLTKIWDFGVAGFLLGTLVGALIVAPFALWTIRQNLSFSFDLRLAKILVTFGSPFILAGLAYWIFGSMDRWMLAELSSNEEVGLYSVAFKITTILIFLNTAFGQAWSPLVMKTYASNPEYKTTISQLFTLWFFVLLMAGSAISLFSPELFYLLCPSTYAPAAYTIPFLITGIVFFGTTQVTALGISLTKRTSLIGWGSWLTAGVNFVLNLLLIPSLGSIGAAVATLCSYMLLTGYYLYWTQRLHPLPLENRKLIWCFVLVMLSCGIAYFLADYQLSLTLLLVKSLVILALIGIGIATHIIPLMRIKVWIQELLSSTARV